MLVNIEFLIKSLKEKWLHGESCSQFLHPEDKARKTPLFLTSHIYFSKPGQDVWAVEVKIDCAKISSKHVLCSTKFVYFQPGGPPAPRPRPAAPLSPPRPVFQKLFWADEAFTAIFDKRGLKLKKLNFSSPWALARSWASRAESWTWFECHGGKCSTAEQHCRFDKWPSRQTSIFLFEITSVK